VVTLQRSSAEDSVGLLIAEVTKLVVEYDAVELIVGLPMNMRGEDTASTEDARAFAHALALVINIPVRLVDERLTTVSASTALRAAGVSSRHQREMIDQQAAVVVLQHAIDSERSSNQAPGHLVSPDCE
jgi:putative Holliday junction resolvase